MNSLIVVTAVLALCRGQPGTRQAFQYSPGSGDTGAMWGGAQAQDWDQGFGGQGDTSGSGFNGGFMQGTNNLGGSGFDQSSHGHGHLESAQVYDPTASGFDPSSGFNPGASFESSGGFGLGSQGFGQTGGFGPGGQGFGQTGGFGPGGQGFGQTGGFVPRSPPSSFDATGGLDSRNQGFSSQGGLGSTEDIHSHLGSLNGGDRSAWQRYQNTQPPEEGYLGAIGGQDGFPAHGGYCGHQECADGGVAAGLGDGMGQGSRSAFEENRRLRQNDDIALYERFTNTGPAFESGFGGATAMGGGLMSGMAGMGTGFQGMGAGMSGMTGGAGMTGFPGLGMTRSSGMPGHTGMGGRGMYAGATSQAGTSDMSRQFPEYMSSFGIPSLTAQGASAHSTAGQHGASSSATSHLGAAHGTSGAPGMTRSFGLGAGSGLGTGSMYRGSLTAGIRGLASRLRPMTMPGVFGGYRSPYGTPRYGGLFRPSYTAPMYRFI